MPSAHKTFACLVASILFAWIPNGAAQDEPADDAANIALPEGSGSAFLEIKPEHLKLQLAPLTREEIAVVAERWRDVLKAKVGEISQRSLEGGGGDSDRMVELQNQKAALLNRFGVVLGAFEAKGGDAEEYRLYAKAVAGAGVDITDVNTTWKSFKAWLRSEEGGIRLAIGVLKFLAIMVVFWFLARIVRRAVRRAAEMNERASDLLEQFIITISYRGVLIVGLLVALGTIGVNVGAMFALIGGASFIVGFALQDSLGNFASGVMLMMYRPFDVGDAVEVGGVLGKIDNVSLVSTTIRTFDNKIVLVPNKKVWGEVITNASASEKRRVDMIFGISYDDDPEAAKAILERIVAENELVFADPEPVIRVHELADSSVNFICRPWTATANYWDVYWNVTGRVKAEFDKAGISIPYPQQDVHLHQVGG